MELISIASNPTYTSIYLKTIQFYDVESKKKSENLYLLGWEDKDTDSQLKKGGNATQ